MNLEPIDTSTTAGKAEVMRLADEGRRVAMRANPFRHLIDHEAIVDCPWIECPGVEPTWSWRDSDYAIIAEPVGPDELWVILSRRGEISDVTTVKDRFLGESNDRVVRYVRADLAGEGNP